MPIVRYDHPPKLVMQYPLCAGCDVEVDSDGDSLVCPDCGTSWSAMDGEDTPGTSYSDWSGEVVSSLPLIEMGPTAWEAVQQVRRNQQQVGGGQNG